MSTPDHDPGTPVQDGHDDATDDEKLAGLITLFSADARVGNVSDPESDLRHRLDSAGIELDDARIARILAGLS